VTERLARRSWGWLILSAVVPVLGTTFFFMANVTHGQTLWAAIFLVLAFAAYLSFVFAIVTKLRARSDRRE
jgi:uncharacterized membrane protein